MRFLLFYAALYMCAQDVLSLRILGIFPYQGKSHYFVYKVYLEELARRGHDVTVISHFPDAKSSFKDISLAGTVKILESDLPAVRSYYVLAQIILFLNGIAKDNCEKLLEVEDVQRLWKTKQKFDLIVSEQFNSDCALGLAYALRAPVVTITSHILMPFQYKRFGIPDNPSFVPFHFLDGGSEPSFYQRIESIVFGVYANLVYKFISQRSNENSLAKYFDNIPPLEELARDVKFTLLYTHFPLTGSRLFPANIIEVGGYHVAEPKSLTGEIKKFIEEAEHGVVYVSFGSLVKTSSLPEEKVQAIINALSKLKQRVIWKWETQVLPGNPKNILPLQWTPQNDILAHPKVVAFYSHGGMLGTTEAIHHGVPMVVMPILGDQPANAASIEECGLGVRLQLADLTSDTLLSALNIVLEPGFRSKVKDLSRMWHDRPLSAMDTAIFWTEFAARYSNFTFRARAADVPFYKYHSLDIIAVVLVPLLLILCVCFKCCGRSVPIKVVKNTKDKKRAKKD